MNNREKFLEHIQKLNNDFILTQKLTNELDTLNKLFYSYVVKLNEDIEKLDNTIEFSKVDIIEYEDRYQFVVFGKVLGFSNVIGGNIAIEINGDRKNEIIDIIINKDGKLFSTLFNKEIEGNEDEVIAGLLYSLKR